MNISNIGEFLSVELKSDDDTLNFDTSDVDIKEEFPTWLNNTSNGQNVIEEKKESKFKVLDKNTNYIKGEDNTLHFITTDIDIKDEFPTWVEDTSNTEYIIEETKENKFSVLDKDINFIKCENNTLNFDTAIDVKTKVTACTEDRSNKKKSKKGIQPRNKLIKTDSVYLCTLCEYKTENNSNFRRHMRIHNKEKTYECEQCDYCTEIKSNLQKHIISVHSNERPFKCDYRGCTFNTALKSNLTKHMSTHCDEFPFKCNHCGFGTKNKTALKNHIATHSDKRKYQCDKCEYSAVDKFKLERHAAVHTNTKNFKCSKCKYSSKRKDTLDKHIKRKH